MRRKMMVIRRSLILFVLVCAASIGMQAAPTFASDMSHRDDDHLILDHPYDILLYRLDLQPQMSAGELIASATIDLRSGIDNLDTVLLNFVGDWSIPLVSVDGQPVTHSHDGNLLAVVLPGGRDAGERFTIHVEYRGRPSSDPEHGAPAFAIAANYAYTFSQPFQARYWFPCFDEPVDKADEGVEIAVTVPARFEVAANGAEVSRTANGSQVRHVWRHNYPISTYLISVAIADYAVVPGAAGDIPLTWYVYPSEVQEATYDFARHPQMFEAFNARFGPYPFDRYGIVMVPSRGFAMEHQTMTLFSENLVTGDRRYESIAAHELAHQWWGDSVTIADYRDIWLNEGFATYSELLWAEHHSGVAGREAVARILRTNWLNQDATDRHSLYRDDYAIRYLFSRTIYNKGAFVLHMLRWELGDEQFFEGLRRYYQRFAYKTVETADFIAVMEEVSGRDLDPFFTGWVYGAGYPEFEISSCLREDGGERRIRVTIRQVQEGETVYAMTLPVDPDGDGPLPVMRQPVSGRWSWVDVPAGDAVEAARIIESTWHAFEATEGDYPQPSIAAVENGGILSGKRALVRLRGSGFTPASQVILSSAGARIISWKISEDGAVIELLVKAARVERKTRVHVTVLNPDGDLVTHRKALVIRPK